MAQKENRSIMTEAELWSKFLSDRTDDNRNALVVFYMPYVRNIAKSLLKSASNRQLTTLDELASSGSVPLIKAVGKFKPGRATFQNYAFRQIQSGMIKDLKKLANPSQRGVGTVDSWDHEAGDSGHAHAIHRRELLAMLESNMWKFSDREVEFMQYHWEQGLSLQVCGDLIGISKQRAGQIKLKIIEILKSDPKHRREDWP